MGAGECVTVQDPCRKDCFRSDISSYGNGNESNESQRELYISVTGILPEIDTEVDREVIIAEEGAAVEEVEEQREPVIKTVDIVAAREDVSTEVKYMCQNENQSPHEKDLVDNADKLSIVSHGEISAESDVEMPDEENGLEAGEDAVPEIDTAPKVADMNVEDNDLNTLTTTDSVVTHSLSSTLLRSTATQSPPAVGTDVQRTVMSALRRKKTRLTVMLLSVN